MYEYLNIIQLISGIAAAALVFIGIFISVKKLNPDTDDEHIIMVDDNVDEVLNYIMNNSGYTTVHISSFM